MKPFFAFATFALAAVASLSPAAVEPFTFIHLSDPHIGSHGNEERLVQALADVDKNFPEAEFIVISGDCTEFGRVDEFTTFTNIIKTSKRPVYAGTGNHDTRWSE